MTSMERRERSGSCPSPRHLSRSNSTSSAVDVTSFIKQQKTPERKKLASSLSTADQRVVIGADASDDTAACTKKDGDDKDTDAADTESAQPPPTATEDTSAAASPLKLHSKTSASIEVVDASADLTKLEKAATDESSASEQLSKLAKTPEEVVAGEEETTEGIALKSTSSSSSLPQMTG